MSQQFVGEIRLFGFNFAPRGWASCNGQIMSIAQNTALFSLLGTTYGGNGQVTFALPDLRGRAAMHFGQGPGLSNYVQGEVTGVESTTISQNQMPMHVHAVAPPVATSSSSKNPVGTVPGLTASAAYNATPSAGSTGQVFQSAIAGGSQPLSLDSPRLTLNYCIAIYGIFPSRN